MKRSRLWLVVAVLVAIGSVLADRYIERGQAMLEESRFRFAVGGAKFEAKLREMASTFRRRAEEAEAKGQDGNAIRRECEVAFKAVAAYYKAETADIQNREARIALTEQRILSLTPECWR